MSADKFMAQQWIDNAAQATRVTMVATDGTSTGSPGSQRSKSIQRITTATTTSVTAGKKAYTFLVHAASASSTTLDGVALVTGDVISWSVISNNDTLPAASLVTVSGDDVTIITLT